MDRRRRKVPRKNQLCLRLNDKQLHLLQRYAEFKDMDSEVDAIRAIIDGLAPWLDRREAEELEKQAHSGLSSTPSGRASIGASVPRPPPTTSLVAEKRPSSKSDGANEHDGVNEHNGSDGDGEEVGDFGGRPRLKLPGMPLEGDLP